MKINQTEINMLEISDLNPEALFADGFEEALIGYVTQGNKTLAAYDKLMCIRILERRDMSREEAEEFFEHNVAGAYVGENTPVFLTRL